MNRYQFRIGETDDGKSVKLDLAAFIDTRGVFIANSGGGKSNAMRTIIEQSADKVQWIIIDPDGEYSSLRESFPNMLLIGEGGEVPVDVKSSKLLVRKIMESRLSVIVDLYGLRDIRAAYTASFINALSNLPRDLWSPVIVAVDEAHRLAPNTPEGTKVEREALYASRKAIITLADSGRKQSRGSVIASQRVSKMAADARAELRNRFIGLHVQDLDRARAADDLGFSKEQARTLRDLKAGQFYVFGPALVGINGIAKIQFDLPKTKHPSPGTKHLLDVPPASDALMQLVAQMGDLPKQIEQETNEAGALRQKIRELENKLRARPVQVQPQVERVTQTVEVPMLKADDAKSLESSIASLSKLGADAINYGNQVIATARELGQSLQTATRFKPQITSPARAIYSKTVPARIPTTRQSNQSSDEALRGGERLILIATAQYPEGVSREQLTVLSGYKRSSRDTYIQRLVQRGLVTASRDRIVATPEGVNALGSDFQPLPTGQALVDYWLNRLTGGEKIIFEIAVQTYPGEVVRDDLDSQSGYKRSSRDTFIQRLQARELLTSGRNTIRASDHLFNS